MIKRRQEMPTSLKTKVKGGNGSYESIEIFTQEETGKTNLFAVNTLPAGASIGVHPHETEGEAYLILQGTATVQEDGVDYILHPGDAEYCTGGHSHGIANDSDEPLVFLAVIIR